MLEYASRAVYDNGTSIGGRTVQMSGFVIPGQDGELMLARMIMSCCAADGRPIKLGMTGSAPVGPARRHLDRSHREVHRQGRH